MFLGNIPQQNLGQFSLPKEPVDLSISVAKLGVTAGQIGAQYAGGVALGLTTTAWMGIGVALAALGAIYGIVKAKWKKERAKEKARMAFYRAINQIGIELIDKVYGMKIPGWKFPEVLEDPSNEYYQLGLLYYNWSKTDRKNSYEIASWIKSKGLEPARFIGADNVPEGLSLDYDVDYIADPEKYLIGKEALEAMGYDKSQFVNLPVQYFVRLIDIILEIPHAFMELQAQMIKADLEYHLREGGFDPKVIFDKVMPSETIPPTMYEITVSPETKQVVIPKEAISLEPVKPEEVIPTGKEVKPLEEKGETIQIAGLSVNKSLLILLGVGLLIAMLKKKEL